MHSVNSSSLSADYRDIDFRKEPHKYQIGRGEQGVLTAEPYKSEILPHWRFATPEKAKASAETIYGLFEQYGRDGDFVGMDMARKFLQMGYTRSRRYANHKGGKKYDGSVPEDKKGISGAHGRKELPRIAQREQDADKVESARIFYEYYKRALAHPVYMNLKAVFMYDHDV